MSLLKYWQLGIGFIAALTLAWFLHSWRVNQIEEGHVKDLEQQAELIQKKCDEAQKKAQEASRVYQNNLSNVNSRLANANQRLREYENGSSTSPSGGYSTAPSRNRLYWEDASAARDALELAAQADRQTHQLIACQNYIKGLE